MFTSQKNKLSAGIVLLSFLASTQAFGLDVDQCPGHLTVVLSGVSRISNQELDSRLKALYNYSSFDPEASGRVVQAKWEMLSGVSEITMSANLFDRGSDECSYTAPETDIWIKIVGKYVGHEKFENSLVVNTRYGVTQSQILSLAPGRIELSQNLSERQFIVDVPAGYEDGGYTSHEVVATAASISVR